MKIYALDDLIDERGPEFRAAVESRYQELRGALESQSAGEFKGG